MLCCRFGHRQLDPFAVHRRACTGVCDWWRLDVIAGHDPRHHCFCLDARKLITSPRRLVHRRAHFGCDGLVDDRMANEPFDLGTGPLLVSVDTKRLGTSRFALYLRVSLLGSLLVLESRSTNGCLACRATKVLRAKPDR